MGSLATNSTGDEGSMMMVWYTEQIAQWERQVERRQLFLKSYQFSAPSPAPRTFNKRLEKSFNKARRLVWARLRRFPRIVWSGLRSVCSDNSPYVFSRLRRRASIRRWNRLLVLRTKPITCFC